MLGWLHHSHFIANGSRGHVSYAHIWWGRILLALGVINGGVGLQMVGEKQSIIVAYSVISAIIFTAWIAVKAMRFFGTSKEGQHKQLNSPQVGPQPHIELPRRPYQKTREDRFR
jgi:predicted lipid-binding transport protein (Tim44 family)